MRISSTTWMALRGESCERRAGRPVRGKPTLARSAMEPPSLENRDQKENLRVSLVQLTRSHLPSGASDSPSSASGEDPASACVRVNVSLKNTVALIGDFPGAHHPSAPGLTPS